MHYGYNERLPIPLRNNIVAIRNTENSLRRPKNNAIPRFQSRYLEQSCSYRGAILWSAITCRDPDLTRANFKKIGLLFWFYVEPYHHISLIVHTFKTKITDDTEELIFGE